MLACVGECTKTVSRTGLKWSLGQDMVVYNYYYYYYIIVTCPRCKETPFDRCGLSAPSSLCPQHPAGRSEVRRSTPPGDLMSDVPVECKGKDADVKESKKQSLSLLASRCYS